MPFLYQDKLKKVLNLDATSIFNRFFNPATTLRADRTVDGDVYFSVKPESGEFFDFDALKKIVLDVCFEGSNLDPELATALCRQILAKAITATPIEQPPANSPLVNIPPELTSVETFCGKLTDYLTSKSKDKLTVLKTSPHACGMYPSPPP